MTYRITNGVVKIDSEDLDKVSKFKWHVSSTGYAVWRGVIDGKKRTIRMHRLITDCPRGLVVDHINHDRLDNRRSNIRICTVKDNMRNLRDHGKGYWFQKQNGNWVVEIYGQHIGVFKTEQEAARVAKHIRAGGTYVKPKRTHCKWGHSLTDAYHYGATKLCRKCQSNRSRAYYKRKHNIK